MQTVETRSTEIAWYRKEAFGFIATPEIGDVMLLKETAAQVLASGTRVADLLPHRLESFEIDPGFHLSAPLITFLEITRNCNIDCPHCYINAHLGKKEADSLSFGAISRLVEELAAMRVPEVEITGGEPFLRTDTEAIINLCLDAGLKVSVTTNGILLSEERLSAIRPGATIKVSFDAITGSGNAHGGLGIHRLESIVDLLEKSGHDFYVVCSVTSLNVDSLGEFYSWLGERGIRVDTAHTMPVGRARSNASWILPSVRDAAKVESTLEDFRSVRRSGPKDPRSQRANYLNFLYNLSSWIEAEFCGRGMLYVDRRGDAFPCNTCAGENAYVAGNVLRQSIQEIWSEGFEAFRAINWASFSACGSCAIAKADIFCPFRCPVLSANLHSGNPTVCGATDFTKRMIQLAHKHD